MRIITAGQGGKAAATRLQPAARVLHGWTSDLCRSFFDGGGEGSGLSNKGLTVISENPPPAIKAYGQPVRFDALRRRNTWRPAGPIYVGTAPWLLAGGYRDWRPL